MAAQQEYAIKQTTEAFSFEDLIVFAEKDKAEKRVLKNAVKKIPARMREALYLKTYDGLSYREIADIMQVRPQVARNYVSEAYRRLRKLLTKH